MQGVTSGHMTDPSNSAAGHAPVTAPQLVRGLGTWDVALITFGTLVGSAIFIAAQVFYWWHKGDRKQVEEHADVAPKYEWQGSSKASE